MAIRISGNTVITDDKVLQNVTGFKTVAGQAILGAGDIAVGGNYRMQVFTSPGTWTKPTGLKAVKVVVVGGGGGTAPQGGSPRGGGGGGTAIKYMNENIIPGPITVTVGPGGGTATPQNGNTSSFGTLCSATGGSGPGSGGVGSNGNINFSGSAGAVPVPDTASGLSRRACREAIGMVCGSMINSLAHIRQCVKLVFMTMAFADMVFRKRPG